LSGFYKHLKDAKVNKKGLRYSQYTLKTGPIFCIGINSDDDTDASRGREFVVLEDFKAYLE